MFAAAACLVCCTWNGAQKAAKGEGGHKGSPCLAPSVQVRLHLRGGGAHAIHVRVRHAERGEDAPVREPRQVADGRPGGVTRQGRELAQRRRAARELGCAPESKQVWSCEAGGGAADALCELRIRDRHWRPVLQQDYGIGKPHPGKWGRGRSTKLAERPGHGCSGVPGYAQTGPPRRSTKPVIFRPGRSTFSPSLNICVASMAAPLTMLVATTWLASPRERPPMPPAQASHKRIRAARAWKPVQ